MRAPAAAGLLLPLLAAAGRLGAPAVTMRCAAAASKSPPLVVGWAGSPDTLRRRGAAVAKLLVNTLTGTVAAAALPLTAAGWGGSGGGCSADLPPERLPPLRQPKPPSRLCLGLGSML
jgi:hypothetical protein